MKVTVAIWSSGGVLDIPDSMMLMINRHKLVRTRAVERASSDKPSFSGVEYTRVYDSGEEWPDATTLFQSLDRSYDKGSVPRTIHVHVRAERQ